MDITPGSRRGKARAAGQVGENNSSNTNTTAPVSASSGSLRGTSNGALVSAIVAATVLGLLALVGAAFLAVRTIGRARTPPIEFEETGDVSPTPPPALEPFADHYAPRVDIGFS